MPRFFVSRDAADEKNGIIVIEGENAHHISRSLRMAVGDRLTVCAPGYAEYDCVLCGFTDSTAEAKIVEKKALVTEPPFKVHVYQALPKGDKLDTVIQKSVECGAYSLTTFESKFCVAKEKAESGERKLERRKKIAEEAAKQSGRGIIPEINPTLSFSEALMRAAKADIPLFCYEGGGTLGLRTQLEKVKNIQMGNKCPEISVMIGAEGGFSEDEAARAAQSGMLMTGLGRRILRTETVAGFVLGCLVYEFEL